MKVSIVSENIENFVSVVVVFQVTIFCIDCLKLAETHKDLVKYGFDNSVFLLKKLIQLKVLSATSSFTF